MCGADMLLITEEENTFDLKVIWAILKTIASNYCFNAPGSVVLHHISFMPWLLTL